MLWQRKNKEEKILVDIKKKKAQLDKLKEEIVQMGKLVLKDGKLQRIDDIKRDEVVVQNSQEAVDTFEKTAKQVVEQVAPPPRSMPRQYAASQPTLLPEEDIVYVKQPTSQSQFTPQQLQQMQMQQQMQEQYEQMQLQQQRLQQLQMQQQMTQQQAQQQLPPIMVNIELVTGSIIQLEVERAKLDSFVEEINGAIDNQSSIPLGSKVINGRNIVMYTFE